MMDMMMFLRQDNMPVLQFLNPERQIIVSMRPLMKLIGKSNKDAKNKYKPIARACSCNFVIRQCNELVRHNHQRNYCQ